MSIIKVKSSYLLRKDTAENWQVKNPILRKGEQGLETDTGIMKIGDGVTAFNSLSDDNIYLPKSQAINFLKAVNISFDKSNSGLDSDNVQDAIDEVVIKFGSMNKPESWGDVQKIVRMGLASKVFTIGDQLTCHRGGETLVWDIIGFDHDVPADSQFNHSMTIQLHDCYTSERFDATEALYYCSDELPAGTYNFSLLPGYDTQYGGGKTYQFTLTKAVPAGGQIMFPWSYNKQASTVLISTYESATSNTAIESVSVTEGSGGTSLGTADGNTENMNHSHRIRYGSNRWLHSSIRQWLNSDKAASAWWTPQNVFDRPPSNVSTDGFLTDMDSEFLAVIGEVNKRTALNTVTDGGGYEDTNELMFLLSRSELYGGLENSVNEGEPYPYYANYSDLSEPGTAADNNRIKYRDGSAQYWWSRSCDAGGAGNARRVAPTGQILNANASYSYRVAPACNII